MSRLMSYEWMTRYTPQEEWIEGGGKLIWLALFFTELGAGLFFVSIFFKNPLGMLLGWFICLLLGGGSFLLHMGKPLRSFRSILKPQTSWISRGVIFLTLFGAIGAVEIVLTYLAPNLDLLLLHVVMCIFCILVAIYAGILMSYVRAIPLWDTGLLPITYLVAGLWGGAELLLGINLLTGVPIERVELWIKVLLPSFALILALYLISVTSSSTTGLTSVKRIVSGDLAIHFYLGVVIIGLVFPVTVVVYSISVGATLVGSPLFLAAIVCGLIGDLTMRYCIMKGALYSPLI